MGCKIKEYREKRGWSQQKLADESGVSRATICGLETGKMLVTKTSTLKKIAGAFGVGVREIFFDGNV